jgi:hypothetical protein
MYATTQARVTQPEGQKINIIDRVHSSALQPALREKVTQQRFGLRGSNTIINFGHVMGLRVAEHARSMSYAARLGI